eukprot:15130869-Alexandrium_andersonii.AAC.1
MARRRPEHPRVLRQALAQVADVQGHALLQGGAAVLPAKVPQGPTVREAPLRHASSELRPRGAPPEEHLRDEGARVYPAVVGMRSRRSLGRQGRPDNPVHLRRRPVQRVQDGVALLHAARADQQQVPLLAAQLVLVREAGVVDHAQGNAVPLVEVRLGLAEPQLKPALLGDLPGEVHRLVERHHVAHGQRGHLLLQGANVVEDPRR